MSDTFGVIDSKLTGKNVLVDDVLTTGATLIACVEQLQKLKPISISITNFGRGKIKKALQSAFLCFIL